MKKVLVVMMLVGSMLLAGLLVSDMTSACSGASCVSSGVDTINTGPDSLESALERVVNMLLFLIGAIAVIMLIIGGLRYTTSNGNQEDIKKAKDIILYSVIGIVVAIFSYAIVRFVVTAFV